MPPLNCERMTPHRVRLNQRRKNTSADYENKSQNVGHHRKSKRIRNQVMFSTGVGADIAYQQVASDINTHRV